MCSRSLLPLLLLLFVLAFVEVSSWPTPRLPLIEDNIDLSKCVATRKGNNQYKCFLRSLEDKDECFNDNQYVQEKNSTSRQPPPTLNKHGFCEFGCTIRPLSKAAWEIEVIFLTATQYFIFELFSKTPGGGSFLVQVSLESQTDRTKVDREKSDTFYIPTIKEVVKDGVKFADAPDAVKIFDDNFKDPGIAQLYNVAKYSLVYAHPHRYYIRFRLYHKKGEKHFSEYSHVVVTRHIDNSPGFEKQVAYAKLYNCPNCKAYDTIELNPCGQMVQMVYRTKSESGWGQLTKIPREAFHHNVHDFAQMCTHLPRYNQPDQVFYPYHVETGYEIVAIECLPEHENDQTPLASRIPYAILRNENGTAMQYNNFKNKYRDNNVNYQFVEVTCRTKEDICFYCGEPEWNKDTASIPRGLAPMIFTAGQNGSCATLACPDDSVPYYPHINFTSLEPPRCEHNAEKDEFEWTFSFQPTTQWNRVRAPLERGYCRKKDDCPPFTEQMLACPNSTAHMPWFTGCVPADHTNFPLSPRYWCANETKQLYFALSRRILQKEAIGVACNFDTGLYEATLPSGLIESGFTEESWVVCRDKPRRRFDTYYNIEVDFSKEYLTIGTIVGWIIPILLVALFIGVRHPIARALKRTRENTLLPEQLPKPVKPKPKQDDEEPGKKKKREDDEDEKPAPVDTDYAKVLAAREVLAKKMAEKMFIKIDHNNDEKTCRLPTKSEQALMDEIERDRQCTSETDRTGREVKPIAREDEPEREEPIRR